MVVFGQRGCIRAKVVVFEQNCFLRATVVVFGMGGCVRAKVDVFGELV